jgi:hypothetical protein
MAPEVYSRRTWLRASAGLAAMLALTACGQAAATAGGAGPVTTSASGLLTTSASSSSLASSLTSAAAATSTTTGEVTSGGSAATGSTATTAVASTVTATTASSTSTGGARSTATATTAGRPAPTASTAEAASPSAGVKLTLAADGTQASYQVQEQLAGHSLPSAAIGRTSAVTGTILLDAGGKIVLAQSKIEIDLRTLKSDQSMRDNYIQHDPLDTAQYPTATFVPKTATGMPWPLPATGTATFTMAGDFTVHGTTAPTTWTVAATFAPDKVTGTATTPFTFTEFGMQAPHTMIALSVQNNGTLTLQFTATRATA